MAITDAGVLQQMIVIRDRFEQLRALAKLIDQDLSDWALVSALVPNDAAQFLEDGQVGPKHLSGADITNLITVLTGLQTKFNQAGVAALVSRACRRPIEIH